MLLLCPTISRSIDDARRRQKKVVEHLKAIKDTNEIFKIHSFGQNDLKYVCGAVEDDAER